MCIVWLKGSMAVIMDSLNGITNINGNADSFLAGIPNAHGQVDDRLVGLVYLVDLRSGMINVCIEFPGAVILAE